MGVMTLNGYLAEGSKQVSLEGVVALVLGSTVVGAIVGAYLQSSRQREEAFRERMIGRAVDFLATVAKAQMALIAAYREVLELKGDRPEGQQEEPALKAIDAASDSVREAWPSIPVLMIVFPRQEVADAASSLVEEMDGLLKAIRAVQKGEREAATVESEIDQVEKAHRAYATLVNRAIRRAAFRRVRC